MKIKTFLDNSDIDKIAIVLSSICSYSAYEIRNVILQLNSIDDTLIVISESRKNNISLNSAVYMRLKRRDEEKHNV